MGKSSRLSLTSSINKSSHVLEVIYSDVWVPPPLFLLMAINIMSYLLILILNIYGIFQWLASLKCLVYFRNLNCLSKTNLIVKLKRSIRTRVVNITLCPNFFNHMEFIVVYHVHIHMNNLAWLNDVKNILWRLVFPNGTFFGSISFWPLVFQAAIFLINRLPSPVSHSKSPIECLFKHTPDYTFLKTFGCFCFPYLRPYNKHKLKYRSKPCVFLGYSNVHKGYRCFDIVSQK